MVVSYFISTSNHNVICIFLMSIVLYLIPFLHQTTTNQRSTSISMRCILFHFYIKPQQTCRDTRTQCVVSYSISTSNHNPHSENTIKDKLYLIPFLHQTTTLKPSSVKDLRCILFHFYIKPQRLLVQWFAICGCILFHFYIKPQRATLSRRKSQVVSYSISTSNHNLIVVRLVHA